MIACRAIFLFAALMRAPSFLNLQVATKDLYTTLYLFRTLIVVV